MLITLVIFPRVGAFEQLFGPGRGEFEQKLFQKFKCPGGCPGGCWSFDVTGKANEDKLLQTHCCRHKCFPLCPRAQHLLRTQILCLGGKKCFWFCSEAFCVRNKCFPVCAVQETSWATMCPQQCVLVYQGLYITNKSVSYMRVTVQ